ncbi:hypothetical protein [Kitasatospora purpeofusca]|uniref:Uncharacterized protein n=1 Tax=Kitasatospora purpeofusca TaxID=67352 RepID=A0ABZ1TWZ7_9ACTN|nr:hypothetical protein [Kitasatospora purpeofusca]
MGVTRFVPLDQPRNASACGYLAPSGTPENLGDDPGIRRAGREVGMTAVQMIEGDEMPPAGHRLPEHRRANRAKSLVDPHLHTLRRHALPVGDGHTLQEDGLRRRREHQGRTAGDPLRHCPGGRHHTEALHDRSPCPGREFAPTNALIDHVRPLSEGGGGQQNPFPRLT